MARPENPALRAQIVACAREQFHEKGYKATSYAELAQNVGITKGLLQYYFPKKDQLATEVMTQVLEESIAALGIRNRAAEHSVKAYGELYRIGQVFFAYLLAPEGYQQFLSDVVSSLDLVDNVLAFNLNWAMAYAQEGERTEGDAVTESVVMTMGGFYSLLHYTIAHKREMDVAKHLGTVMREVMRALGFSEAEVAEAIDGAALSPKQLKPILAKMSV